MEGSFNDTDCRSKSRNVFLFQLKNHDSELSEIKFALNRTNANLAERRNETYGKVTEDFLPVSTNLKCFVLSQI